MKRVSVFLAVVAAFGVAAASAAWASAPEYGVCVPMKKGAYEVASCEVIVGKKGKERGLYEWHPAGTCYAMKKGYYTEGECKTVAEKKGKPDHKGGFELAPTPTYTSATGAVRMTFAAPLAGEATCDAGSDEGQILGPKSGADLVQLTGCEMRGEKCENTSTAGEISSNELETTLIEPRGGTAAEELANAHGASAPYSVEFFCEQIGYFRTKGSLAGRLTPVDVMSASLQTVFEAGYGQQLVTEYSETGAPGSWTGEADGAAGEAATEELLSATSTNSAAIEVKVI